MIANTYKELPQNLLYPFIKDKFKNRDFDKTAGELTKEFNEKNPLHMLSENGFVKFMTDAGFKVLNLNEPISDYRFRISDFDKTKSA